MSHHSTTPVYCLQHLITSKTHKNNYNMNDRELAL